MRGTKCFCLHVTEALILFCRPDSALGCLHKAPIEGNGSHMETSKERTWPRENNHHTQNAKLQIPLIEYSENSEGVTHIATLTIPFLGTCVMKILLGRAGMNSGITTILSLLPAAKPKRRFPQENITSLWL